MTSMLFFNPVLDLDYLYINILSPSNIQVNASIDLYKMVTQNMLRTNAGK